MTIDIPAQKNKDMHSREEKYYTLQTFVLLILYDDKDVSTKKAIFNGRPEVRVGNILKKQGSLCPEEGQFWSSAYRRTETACHKASTHAILNNCILGTGGGACHPKSERTHTHTPWLAWALPRTINPSPTSFKSTRKVKAGRSQVQGSRSSFPTSTSA